ncbi:hypothetical protein [Ensifer sesbaniae]|jgi:hypothetical protein|nr:hypothetical protein [Ensifer sesbaniae]NRQ15361.1 hypothetical protein [Ensifer sesbaniae]
MFPEDRDRSKDVQKAKRYSGLLATDISTEHIALLFVRVDRQR